MSIRTVLVIFIFVTIVIGGSFLVAQKFLIVPAAPKTIQQVQEDEIVDTSSWQDFENNYIRLKYPPDWEKRTVAGGAFYSPDRRVTLLVSPVSLKELRTDVSDWYEFHKSFELGVISNERDLAVNDFSARAYDVKEDTDTKTEIVFVTENYLYTFTLRPNASHPLLISLLNTIEIKVR